ncbi:MAG: hypothetical protein JWN48_5994 [Myxococcaceae bacterium]|nr:hypothetical protein [Myxococcaceae bacterium]
MRWIFGLLGALVGSVFADEEGLALGAGLGLLVGWLIEREQQRTRALRKPAAGPSAQSAGQTFEQRASARLVELTRRVEQLERTVAALQAAAPNPGFASPPAGQQEALPALPAQKLDERGFPVDVPTQSGPEPSPLSWREYYEEQEEKAQAERLAARTGAALASPAASLPSAAVSSPGPGAEPRAVSPAESTAPDSALVDALRSFFFGGNTVVRIGILVLTIGVGLLVKYAADADYFPLELRLAFAGAIGLGLVGFGFMQRSARPGFGTALQGGGIAAMYLVTYFAYYAYQLLPPSLTLALLIAVAAFSSVLAVLQNAQQLAVFGAIGGFLSPVLASSGGGSHVALFAYYALLNLAICGIAVFRSWRILNWTGFLFTFGIASAWGALQYKPENRLSASAFLALFFVLYVVDGTLFALRQPIAKRGTIDTTLTFGTPLATLALASGLFQDEHLLLALSCVVIASVYLGFAYALIRLRDLTLTALSRAYIAVGIGVATLAIPFALDDALGTALAWAAEASGLCWVGIRQQRLRTRVASYLLFGAAVLSLLVHAGEPTSLVRGLFCALIALALGFAAALVERHRSVLTQPERYVGHTLLTFALLVWVAACAALIEHGAPLELRGTGWLVALALTTLALELLGAGFAFHAARQVSTFAFPILLLGLLDLRPGSHPFAHLGWLGLLLASAAAYASLARNQSALRERPTRADVLHASAAYFFALLAYAEVRFLTVDTCALAAGWSDAAQLLAPLLVVGCALAQKPSWPLAAYTRAYLGWAAWPISLGIALLALLSNGFSDGSAAPLPYLPLLNPLDLSQAITIALLLLVARSPGVRSERTARIALWSAGLLGFVALNATVVRTAHHWADIPFIAWDVPTAPAVQASFSILWTTLALIAMLVAHRQRERGVWVAGAVLLGAVVVKLFFVDLSSLGGVAKIVTFLAVGLLLLLIGYFAPVPPARRASERPPPTPPPEPAPTAGTAAQHEERP